MSTTSKPNPVWHLYVPKLVTVLRQGYSRADLGHDLLAGLTLSIVALPLSMALAIASGVAPAIGLHTAIIAGFLISALGGSRVQIGGPTAAFIPIIFNIIDKFGYEGLLIATLMAGALLILAGIMRVGTLMKYMPQPVVTGFTAGIAVSIFSSQLKDFFGLAMDKVPAEFFARWQAYFTHFDTINGAAAALALITLGILIVLRIYRPRWPGFLIAVVAAALAAMFLQLPVETIGSRFGSIPQTLPNLHFPLITLSRLQELLPSAFTIAFLAGMESLLSAVVADGMIGSRHRSNCELVAQGVANTASALFGGLPATGAIVRTATNIRAGARSPISGMTHAVCILVFVLFAAPLANYVPLPAMAALLLLVAWNMSEVEHIRQLMHAPIGDRWVFGLTFVLTVMFDLTLAVEVGVVLAAFLFMHHMAQVVGLEAHIDLLEEDQDDLARAAHPNQRAQLPAGVEAYRVQGPLFFAVANRLDEVLDTFLTPPKVFILRMRSVPFIDASGVSAIKALIERCRRQGTQLIFAGIQEQPRRVLERMEVSEDGIHLRYAESFVQALEFSKNDADPYKTK